MRIRFLASTRRDLTWFRRYYESVFSEGAQKAKSRYLATLAVLRENPRIGHPTDDGNLTLSIPRTPFKLIYRLGAETIDILRVMDGRAGTEQDMQDEGQAE